VAIPRDYYNFFDVCKMEGIPKGSADSSAFYGLSGIARMEKLKPIGHLFKEFEKAVRGGMRKQYGIKRTYYDYWKKYGEAPKLPTGRPLEGKVEMKIHVPEEIRDEFYAIVKTAKKMSDPSIRSTITYSSMASVAIKEFNDRRKQILDGDT